MSRESQALERLDLLESILTRLRDDLQNLIVELNSTKDELAVTQTELTKTSGVVSTLQQLIHGEPRRPESNDEL